MIEVNKEERRLINKKRKVLQTPELSAKRNAKRREQYALAKAQLSPELSAKKNAKRREQYALALSAKRNAKRREQYKLSPELSAKRNAKRREQYALAKPQLSPELSAKKNAKRREQYTSELSVKRNAKQREQYALAKAQLSAKRRENYAMSPEFIENVESDEESMHYATADLACDDISIQSFNSDEEESDQEQEQSFEFDHRFFSKPHEARLEDLVNDNFLLNHTRNNEVQTLMEKIACMKSSEINGGDCNQRSVPVCVVCDCYIIGTEKVEIISKELLEESADKLSSATYIEHFGAESLNNMLLMQYRVEDDDLHDLLLSPRSRYIDSEEGYHCCNSCYASLSQKKNKNCPKYAIANGFAIGEIPDVLEFIDKDGMFQSIQLVGDDGNDREKEEYLSDLISAAISPVRPFGYVQAYTGGSQKSVKGHFSLFSVDQSHVGGVLNKFNEQGGKNIYAVLCGRMTPGQKALVRRRAKMDTTRFLNLLNWFVRSSGHKGYADVTPPDNCPDPIAIIQDEDKENNTDESIDPSVELKMGGKTYYFSSGPQNPSQDNSVYDTSQDFISEMLDNAAAPTMLMYGGAYKKSHQIRLEDAFPIQFPFGVGGPKLAVDRRVKVSADAALRHYMRLSLKQFMRPEFILVCYQMLCRSESYSTGLIKCKSSLHGKNLGEKLSKLSAEDVKQASRNLAKLQREQGNVVNVSLNGTSGDASTDATAFLKSVTSSCKTIGHTSEAAKDARRKLYAMHDRLGAHSVFFTFTPDDECTFRVRMYANEGKELRILKPDCDECECIADFAIRAKTRVKYPGACSLYYQDAVQQVYKLIGWDYQKNRPTTHAGIFGRCKAIFRADEEQGRGTLHAHCLIWIEYFESVRRLLFAEDETTRNAAREKMRRYIDSVFCADYGYNENIELFHDRCGMSGNISTMIEEREMQVLRDCRAKSLKDEMKGKVLTCLKCKELGMEDSSISTCDLAEMYMKAIAKKYMNAGDGHAEVSNASNGIASDGDRQLVEEVDLSETYVSPAVEGEADTLETSSPSNKEWKGKLSKERIDLLTYRYPMDRYEGLLVDDSFYSDREVRDHIATKRMNEHDYNHRPACFKYGGECRFSFPFRCKEECEVIFEEGADNESKATEWRELNGSKTDIYPYQANVTRGMGSQFLNTHSNAVTALLGCNSNIQIGNPRCIFYVVHYATKSTQKEDKGVDFERIGHQVINRIQKENDRLMEANMTEHDQDDCFREGLCRFLIGMSIHLSQDVVSSTMSHLLISQRGSRFSYSQQFRHLLLGQMLKQLDGEHPGDFVLQRRNKGEDGDYDFWPDYSINDYLFRPTCLEAVSFYEFTCFYEKKNLSWQRMAKQDEEGFPELKKGEMRFQKDHPGRRYCVLKKNSDEKIPIVSMPKGMICDLQELELDNDEPTDLALASREMYAKAALVLFAPLRNDSIFAIQQDDSLWDKMIRLIEEENEETFCAIGSSILQNIQDRIQGRKCCLPEDEVKANTELRNTEDRCNGLCGIYDSDGEMDDYDDANSLYDEGEGGEDTGFNDNFQNRKLDDMVKGEKLGKHKIISSRLVLDNPIFKSDTVNSSAENQIENVMQENNVIDEAPDRLQCGFRTLLAFVSGAVIGHHVDNIGEGTDVELSYLQEFQQNDIITEREWENIGISTNTPITAELPTMMGICKTVARERKIFLDRIQYVAYEVICCSFLIDVLKRCWDKTAAVDSGFVASGLDDDATRESKDKILNRLYKMGAKDQLLMFMTGPAGAGKSTAIEVAQQFCYEFCKAVEEMFTDKTFYFTALSGCAAAMFGGVTLHSAAFLYTKDQNITTDMLAAWEEVRLLIIDEISFATVDQIDKLNDRLNMIRRKLNAQEGKELSPNMVFGGYSIIFSGDFNQIPPVRCKGNNLLWKKAGLWENAINVAIFLDNSHRFKDDPEYGSLLKRMWNGEFNQDDCNTINSRLMNHRVKLPLSSPDNDCAESDISYACWANRERISIHASIFQKHIQNFPLVDSDEPPPDHTVVIEADIRHAPKSRPRKVKSGSVQPLRARVTPRLCDKIYAKLGDNDMKDQNKQIDPALKLYVGCHCMIIDNDNIKEGRGNGTLCRVVSLKRKPDAPPLSWKSYDGRKVYTTNASDIEYVEFEHFPKSHKQKELEKSIADITAEIDRTLDVSSSLVNRRKQFVDELSSVVKSRRFKLTTKRYYCTFFRSDLDPPEQGIGLKKRNKKSEKKQKVVMVQLPVNLNDATTAHKLQGASKNLLIVNNWAYSHGWVYTVLSRVRTLRGLFLNAPLIFKKDAFQLPQELLWFRDRLKKKIPPNAKR